MQRVEKHDLSVTHLASWRSSVAGHAKPKKPLRLLTNASITQFTELPTQFRASDLSQSAISMRIRPTTRCRSCRAISRVPHLAGWLQNEILTESLLSVRQDSHTLAADSEFSLVTYLKNILNMTSRYRLEKTSHAILCTKQDNGKFLWQSSAISMNTSTVTVIYWLTHTRWVSFKNGHLSTN